MNILILCTGNSCRSQMADACLYELVPEDFSIYSAGLEKHGLNPMAMKCLQKYNYPTGRLQSLKIEDLPNLKWDLVITVCDHAAESCPQMQAGIKLHYSFPDPPKMSKGMNDAESFPIYEKVFLEIKERMSQIAKDYF